MLIAARGFGGGYHARTVEFTFDGAMLMVGCDDGDVYVYDHVMEGVLAGSLRGNRKMVNGLVGMVNDDNLVATAGEDGCVRIFNIQTKSVVHTFEGVGEGGVRGIVVTGAGKRMVFGGERGEVVVVTTQ